MSTSRRRRACGVDVCEKPRIKCGERPNQAFLDVPGQVSLNHLHGGHAVAVYPLPNLKEERCWFLAVDFDKPHRQEDISDYVTTVCRFELTSAVERFRFGNGAKV